MTTPSFGRGAGHIILSGHKINLRFDGFPCFSLVVQLKVFIAHLEPQVMSNIPFVDQRKLDFSWFNGDLIGVKLVIRQDDCELLCLSGDRHRQRQD